MPPFTLLYTIRFTHKVLAPLNFVSGCLRLISPPPATARILLPIIRANIWAWNLSAAKCLRPSKMRWWWPLFEVDYSPLLRCGAVFAIMEAGKCVGMGRVEAVRFQAAV